MIELNSVVVILMVEALAALLLIIFGWWLWSSRKKSGDMRVAHDLIDSLQNDKDLKTHRLSKLIAEHCELEAHELQSLLKDIDGREKALYQQIIQIFLNRDPKKLHEVNDFIQDMAKPYCAVLKQAANSNAGPDFSVELEASKAAILKLTQQNKALSVQLREALKTADIVSDEYAQMFNGHKDESELRASYKRLLYVFQTVESDLKKSLSKI